ncbi:hypothetical protein [Nocardia sp. NPDC051833]|uniref:hypothetical protein n=1 Tax=Nocardia sp. NPDC051833 TaxID=3155674 RepID=UPI0034204F18
MNKIAFRTALAAMASATALILAGGSASAESASVPAPVPIQEVSLGGSPGAMAFCSSAVGWVPLVGPFAALICAA